MKPKIDESLLEVRVYRDKDNGTIGWLYNGKGNLTVVSDYGDYFKVHKTKRGINLDVVNPTMLIRIVKLNQGGVKVLFLRKSDLEELSKKRTSIRLNKGEELIVEYVVESVDDLREELLRYRIQC